MPAKRMSLLALIALFPSGLEGQKSGPIPRNVTSAARVFPLASYEQGQAMMTAAAQRLALLDLNFSFLNKEYKDDTYATDVFGNKYRTGCYRLKLSSGFKFKVDVPQFTLTPQGLTVTQNIPTIKAEGLSAKAQVLACQEISVGVGIHLSDVKVTYTARPVISFAQSNGACTITWNQDLDNFRVTIGGMNILGLQNDLDKLAKDAVREAVNLSLDGVYGSLLRNELTKVSVNVCGSPGK